MNEEHLRQGFKYLNRFMLFIWRLGLGGWLNGWPSVGGRIMVITHTGRKSGLRRQTPVNYALVDGEIYCTAGFGRLSDWYRNIQVNPQVEVWLPDGWWVGTAVDVSDDARRLFLLRQVIIASGFAGRLAGLDPYHMPDAEFAAATNTYCLLQIRREAACTGPGGPGELAWVWPLLVMIGLPLLIWQRRKR